MTTVALSLCIGFLALASLLFWLSRLLPPELAEDAALSAGCAVAALGAWGLAHGGLFWGALGPVLLLAMRRFGLPPCRPEAGLRGRGHMGAARQNAAASRGGPSGAGTPGRLWESTPPRKLAG
jgi:hypothetical protein